MSRPFSYNDENFTVIGNLLIIHVAYKGAPKANDSICKIPPEIAKRLKYSGFVGTYNRSPDSLIMLLGFYVNNCTLHISRDGSFKNGEFFAIVDLKDI